jgi:hypothetical protein
MTGKLESDTLPEVKIYCEVQSALEMKLKSVTTEPCLKVGFRKIRISRSLEGSRLQTSCS